MSLHDRDYVREKDFNYKKMEYSRNTNFNENDEVTLDHHPLRYRKSYPSLRSILRETSVSDSDIGQDSFDIVRYVVYPITTYVIGLFVYFFIAIHIGGQNLSILWNFVFFNFFYFSFLYYHFKNS